jgi:hypothetical protein
LLGTWNNQSLSSSQSKQSDTATPTLPTAIQISPSLFTSTRSGSLISTANWKTYINTKYRYSIKYPENWHIAIDFEQEKPSDVRLENEDFIFLTPDMPCWTCGGVKRGITIEVSKLENRTNSLNYVTENIMPKYVWREHYPILTARGSGPTTVVG